MPAETHTCTTSETDINASIHSSKDRLLRQLVFFILLLLLIMETYRITIEQNKDWLYIMHVYADNINSSIWMHFETREEAVKHALYYIAQYMKEDKA